MSPHKLQNQEVPFTFAFHDAANGEAGFSILSDTRVLWVCSAPIELEHFWGGKRTSITAGYRTLNAVENGLEGATTLELAGTEIAVTDRWSLVGDTLHVERTCRVLAEAQGGFLTRLRLNLAQQPAEPLRPFVPGMIYGGPDHLTPVAIGGEKTWQPGRQFSVLIREDRMPAPLAALFVPGGFHLALFDAAPTGRAPMRDTQDTRGEDMILDGMTLNSLGFEQTAENFSMLFCAPANEGEMTYQGTTYPGGQLHAWRRRYQLLRAEAEVQFSAGLRISNEDSFAVYAANSWRTVFAQLDPRAPHQDLEAATDALVRTLVAQVRDIPGVGRGLINFLDVVSKTAPNPKDPNNNAILGFTGKNIESANFMLRWADDHPDAEGDLARKEGEAIIHTFLRLKVDPPEGEGFSMTTGEVMLALNRMKRVYLRSFGDDMKSLARAYLREKALGRAHPEWADWLARFAGWLLGQQRADGSFPRAWEPVTGVVVEESPWTTYNPIPFLALMTEITGDAKYLDAALRAGEFCWSAGHKDFVFIGGTIDNPDIIDKEAGTLSLEAYLALQMATGDKKWIERAETAARFAETFIYIWDAPIPADEDDSALHWKKGVSTIGLSIIATGHSLCDAYMAFDVDDFARVYALTGDEHYLDVARILLHGTKSMLSLPGRLFDLSEPGWQQEHWSIAPRRGYGLHRGWLPWVSTSHLAGIYDLKDFDADLYARLAAEA